jgi:hypothetical protein
MGFFDTVDKEFLHKFRRALSMDQREINESFPGEAARIGFLLTILREEGWLGPEESPATGEEVWAAVCLGLKGDAIDDGEPAGAWALSIFDAFKDHGWGKPQKKRYPGEPKIEDHVAALRLWLDGRDEEIKTAASRAFVSHVVGLFGEHGWKKPEHDPVKDARRELRAKRMFELLKDVEDAMATITHHADRSLQTDYENGSDAGLIPARAIFSLGSAETNARYARKMLERAVDIITDLIMKRDSG